LSEVEVFSRIERRRKWSASEKAALLAEIEAEGGRVSVVARRHRIAESVLYGWRSALRAAGGLNSSASISFVPLGIVDHRPNDDPKHHQVSGRVPVTTPHPAGHQGVPGLPTDRFTQRL